jgi:hypothetical protein
MRRATIALQAGRGRGGERVSVCARRAEKGSGSGDAFHGCTFRLVCWWGLKLEGDCGISKHQLGILAATNVMVGRVRSNAISLAHSIIEG